MDDRGVRTVRVKDAGQAQRITVELERQDVQAVLYMLRVAAFRFREQRARGVLTLPDAVNWEQATPLIQELSQWLDLHPSEE